MINFVLLVRISARYIISFLITAVSVESVSCKFCEMSITEKQKAAIKFCCHLKISATEIMQLMPDGEQLGDSTMFRRYKVFSDGKEVTSCTKEMVNTETVLADPSRSASVYVLDINFIITAADFL